MNDGLPDKKPLIPNPEGALVAAPRRLSPDVAATDVIGAAGGEQAISGDWWFKSGRALQTYREDATKVARDLGYELPGLFEIAEGQMGGSGYLPGLTPQQMFEARLDGVLTKAKTEHPDAFKDLPITEADMRQRVTDDLKAELADLRETLGQAPDSFLGNTLPDFLGRVAVTGSDQVNGPLTLLTAGLGSGMSLTRTILMEAGLNAGAEAASLPTQNRMAERLGEAAPDATRQILAAAAFGAVIPVGIRGLQVSGRALAGGVRITNEKLVETLRARASKLSDAERGAFYDLEAGIAAETVGPAANGKAGAQAQETAIGDMDAGRAPSETVAPAPDAARVDGLITAPRDEGPAPAPATPATPPKLSLEANLGALIRDAEARGSYDTVSDFSVVLPDRPITEMTLDEIDALQAANIEGGAQSTSIGGYQFLRDTLLNLRSQLGLTGKEKFTPALQDRLALALMEGRGLADFRAGTITADEFADSLAGEWAGLPLADGSSRYAGDGLNAATIDRESVMAVLSGEGYDTVGRPPPRMTRIPAASVQVDPQTYQFRSDVDAQGVTTGLDRVSEWDELLAGDFIVHERFDGSRFIADGHHRTALAGRLESQGHAPIDFNAFVLREADGYSVEHVRAIAAIKNIEAGNATAIDAAKVLRVDPDMLSKLTLRNTQARDARGLMALSDESFDMVTNGIVPEGHAAFVGTLTRDGSMQDAIMRTLARTKPRNLAEARQIAQDAQRAGLAAREKDAQASLFGDDWDRQETLFKERAKVLASAFSQLRQDSKLFKMLVAEEGRIAQAGNQLDTATNKQRATTDETALALIEKLVNRAGPLDDALTAAAKRIRAGASLGGGVRDFVGTVRGAVEGGDLRRLLSGEPGSAKHADAPDGRAAEGAGTGETPGGAQGQSTEGIGQGFDLEAPSPAAARVGLADAFDDPSPKAPAVLSQMTAAENDLRAALNRGEDLQVVTGREIDGRPETLSLRDLFDDMDHDTEFLGALDVCKP